MPAEKTNNNVEEKKPTDVDAKELDKDDKPNNVRKNSNDEVYDIPVGK